MCIVLLVKTSDNRRFLVVGTVYKAFISSGDVASIVRLRNCCDVRDVEGNAMEIQFKK
jgi:hypothetical protein